MNDAHTLTRHRDIQAWVADRRGSPAMLRAPNSFGEMRAKLALRFNDHRRPDESVDQGISPVSWAAWLAELDRQQLALRVGTDESYEFVERNALN